MDSLTILALKKAESGGGGDITVESLSVSQNGTYTATTGKAYSPVSVAVPQTTVTSLSVTENGTYTATEGTAYSPVTVNVPTGGGSNWTLIASKEYTVNTSSTSETSLGTIEIPLSYYDKNNIFWVHVRDKAGKRNGYFYGSESIWFLVSLANGSKTAITTSPGFTTSISSTGAYSTQTSKGGVYSGRIDFADDNHTITMHFKYNSSISKTIDGTYKCDVYVLTLPTGMTMFEVTT